jgi:hypothetical protein
MYEKGRSYGAAIARNWLADDETVLDIELMLEDVEKQFYVASEAFCEGFEDAVDKEIDHWNFPILRAERLEETIRRLKKAGLRPCDISAAMYKLEGEDYDEAD